jgi:hypothetical protein
MPAEGEVLHTADTLRDVFEEFGPVQRVKLAKTDGTAVLTFKWLADAKSAASVKLVEFNYKAFLDKKIRGFKSIGMKVASMPPPLEREEVPDDMFAGVLLARDHERFICIDTSNTVCNVTIPMKFHDHSWKELDLRHQYLNDKAIKKVCHAIQNNQCRTLTSLNFSYNKLTDKGARMVLQLVKDIDTITEVYLHHQRPEICWKLPLAVGMPVEARYDGKTQYYPAIISSGPFDNGRYNVQYADGDMNRDMPRELIRVPREISRAVLQELEFVLTEHRDFVPVGMSTGAVRNEQLAKSGGWLAPCTNEQPTNDPFHPSKYDPQNPRAGIKWYHPQTEKHHAVNRNNCMFIDGHGHKKFWAQISLGEPVLLSAVATVGRGDRPSWVKSYKIQYKPAVGARWKTIKELKTGKDRIFEGNVDQYTTVRNTFLPMKAQVMRIVPWTVHKAATLRFEFFQVTAEDYTAKCTASSVPCKCTMQAAVVWCDDCYTPFCLGCDMVRHRCGESIYHNRFPIEEYTKEWTGQVQQKKRVSLLATAKKVVAGNLLVGAFASPGGQGGASQAKSPTNQALRRASIQNARRRFSQRDVDLGGLLIKGAGPETDIFSAQDDSDEEEEEDKRERKKVGGTKRATAAVEPIERTSESKSGIRKLAPLKQVFHAMQRTSPVSPPRGAQLTATNLETHELTLVERMKAEQEQEGRQNEAATGGSGAEQTNQVESPEKEGGQQEGSGDNDGDGEGAARAIKGKRWWGGGVTRMLQQHLRRLHRKQVAVAASADAPPDNDEAAPYSPLAWRRNVSPQREDANGASEPRPE